AGAGAGRRRLRRANSGRRLPAATGRPRLPARPAHDGPAAAQACRTHLPRDPLPTQADLSNARADHNLEPSRLLGRPTDPPSPAVHPLGVRSRFRLPPARILSGQARTAHRPTGTPLIVQPGASLPSEARTPSSTRRERSLRPACCSALDG